MKTRLRRASLESNSFDYPLACLRSICLSCGPVCFADPAAGPGHGPEAAVIGSLRRRGTFRGSRMKLYLLIGTFVLLPKEC